jgi:aminoglycoside phosphotransferase (APT) family kinase protein
MSSCSGESILARVVQRVAPGSRLVRAWPLAGGSSAGMTALELAAPDGALRRLVLRRPNARALAHNPQAAANEFRLLQALQAQGVAAPAPLALDASGEILPGPYLVLAYVEGRPAFAPAELSDALGQMAAHLARVHHADCHDLPFLALQTGYAETGAPPGGDPAWLDAARIRDLLARRRPASGNRPALLHGDYWPGNLLWRSGRLVAVVDWEDARLGDPLIDLAIARLDTGWIHGPFAMQALTRHYQAQMKLDYAGLPYWDLDAALRLARLAGDDLDAWTAFFRPLGRYDLTPHTFRQHMSIFIGQALAQIAS